jgi:acyl carrier protein
LSTAFRQAVCTYLRRRGVAVDPVTCEVHDGLRIVSDKLIDSISLLELILLVEQQIASELPENELTNANFDTIEGMCALIGRRQPDALAE